MVWQDYIKEMIQNDPIVLVILSSLVSVIIVLIVMIIFFRSNISERFTNNPKKEEAEEVEMPSKFEPDLFMLEKEEGKRTRFEPVSLNTNIKDIASLISKKTTLMEITLKRDIRKLETERKVELEELNGRKRQIQESKIEIETLVKDLKETYNQTRIQEAVIDRLMSKVKGSE